MRVEITTVIQVAIPFIWLGAVLGISFLEAPLKFRAPGITAALGLGIGRLVFRALNVAEVVLAAVLTTAVLVSGRGLRPDPGTAVLIALWLLLAVQLAGLRPRLNARTRLVLAGETPPRSYVHQAYIVLEVLKVALLAVLGVILVPVTV